MTTTGNVSTKGFDGFLEAIEKMGRDMEEAAHRAVLAGGNVALNGMKERVQNDTYNLEKHLVVIPKQHGYFVYVEVGLIGADADTARYANAQEYGTSSMAAHPYIHPTINEDKAKVRRAMIASFKESMQ